MTEHCFWTDLVGCTQVCEDDGGDGTAIDFIGEYATTSVIRFSSTETVNAAMFIASEVIVVGIYTPDYGSFSDADLGVEVDLSTYTLQTVEAAMESQVAGAGIRWKFSGEVPVDGGYDYLMRLRVDGIEHLAVATVSNPA